MYNFKKELIITDMEAVHKEDLFDQVKDILVEHRICTELYIEDVKNREIEFPTGINLSEIGIAMPHARSVGALKNEICLIKLKKPIKFNSMENVLEEIDVSIVFLLVVADEKKHMEMLNRLMSLISDEEMLRKILKVESKIELVNILNYRGGK